jgi:hypothetical protein
MPLLELESVGRVTTFELPKFHGGKIDIGRDANNDIVITGQDTMLHHVSIVRSVNGFYVLVPREGSETLVNNLKILDLKLLRNNDVITIGDINIKYLEIQKILIPAESDLIGVRCLFCQDTFKEGDEVIYCPKCDSPYHDACWSILYNDTCKLQHCGYFIEKIK